MNSVNAVTIQPHCFTFLKISLFLNVVCLIKQLGRSAVTRGCGPETTPCQPSYPPIHNSCLVRMLNVTGKMNLYLMLSGVTSLYPMCIYFLPLHLSTQLRQLYIVYFNFPISTPKALCR